MSDRLPLHGLTVLVTGEIPGLDRDEAKAAVAALGGTAVGSVSGRTALVVAGAGAGVSKMDKARRIAGLRVLDGVAFAALAADPAGWDGQPLGVPVTPPVARVATPVSQHPVRIAITYPPAGREIRLGCACGHRWTGSTVHDLAGGCPRDPERPRADAEPAAAAAAAAVL
jgi:hypothetical protein